MAIPVLKNRILLITGGHFRESEFGASSFRDFLSRLPPGTVVVDEAQSPGFVVLGDYEPAIRSPHVSAYPRIRSDLWRAVLDYSSGRSYVWDLSQQQARPALPNEKGPFLPTVTPIDSREWRDTFAAAHADGFLGDAAARLSRWTSEGLPTAFLPARLRPLWNAELKRRIEERLKRWFEENRIEPPSDLISTQQIIPASGQDPGTLRQFVIDCIKVMTDGEVAALPIPARVAMRVRLANRQ